MSKRLTNSKTRVLLPRITSHGQQIWIFLLLSCTKIFWFFSSKAGIKTWRTWLFQEMVLKENHYFGRRIWVKTITKSLPLKHANVWVLLKFQTTNCAATVRLCNCVCETVCSCEDDTLLSYVTDDSSFYTKDHAINEAQKHLLVDTSKLTHKVA